MHPSLVLLLALLLLLLGSPLVARAEGDDEALPDFDKLWNYGKPAETEQAFRALLPRAEASGDLDYLLSLRTQISRTFGLRGMFDEAHAEQDEIEKLLTDETNVARIRYLLERGRTWNSSGHPEKAKPRFEKAWALATAAKEDYYAIDAAHMMGIVEEPAKQVAWTEKALALAEATEAKRAKGWLGTLYNNLGWTYFELGIFEKALDIHQRGWEWRKKIGQDKPTRKAKWAVARMLRALERYDEALKLQAELEAEWKEAGEENGFVYEEMGELMLVLDREAEAMPYFVKAWPLLKEMGWLKESEPERYARLQRLAGEEGEGDADSR